MASGVEPSDACIEAYQQLKLGKKIKYVLLTLNTDNTQIVVDKTSTSASYDDFVDDLPKDACRWAIYDFEFEKEGEGRRNKLGFISWSPDTANIKDKMVFASSREGIRRKLDGIAFEVQGTDPSEISYHAVLDKAQISTY